MTIGDLYAMFGEATIQAELINQRIQSLRSQILEHIQSERLIEAKKLAEVPPEDAPKPEDAPE
jgi:hypothetical protein